ncbi:hypothetical protein BKD02_01545 [Brucella sp. 09RB8910]|nr:hypothetical protein BKD02_01545 [Brucella sp. 09RB8910]
MLRFFAAAAVVLYHVNDWSPARPEKYAVTLPNLIFIQGHAGVSLFLVMSGYLMARIFMKYPNATYWEFISNRLIRIAPLFLLLVMGSIALKDGSPDIFRAAINILTLQFNVDRSILTIAPLWTIATEFQFYLLMPLLAAIIAKQGLRAILLMCVVICFFRFLVVFHSMQYATFSYNAVYFTLLGRFEQFAVGIFIAHRFADISKKARNPIHLIISIALIVAVEYAGATNNWWGRDLYQSLFQSLYLVAEGAAFGYLIIAYLSLKTEFRVEYAFAYLGAASYSIYLLHELIIRNYMSLVPSYLIGVRYDAMLIILPIICTVSVLSFKYFETPFLQFRKRYS